MRHKKRVINLLEHGILHGRKQNTSYVYVSPSGANFGAKIYNIYELCKFSEVFFIKTSDMVFHDSMGGVNQQVQDGYKIMNNV